MNETIKDYHIIDRETIKNKQSVVSSSMVVTIINVSKDQNIKISQYQNNEDEDEDDNDNKIEKLEVQIQKFRIM
jgi:hypothetical protein